MKEELIRTEMLIGAPALERLAGAKVAVFGLGGVGGYVVEALARSGVSAECALALEDSRNGVASAHAAGLRCIGYLPCRTGQDLSAADGLIARLPELLAWVRPSGHSCV